MKNKAILDVYYDGMCPLCTKEINHYRSQDRENKLRFVDISLPHFQAKLEGLDEVKVKKYFHVKKRNGQTLVGVEAFYQIWEVLNIFKPLRYLYKLPVGKQVMDISYFAFAQVRPYLPKRKCEEGICYK